MRANERRSDRLRRIIHPDDLRRIQPEIQRVIETRDPFRVSFRAMHQSGQVVHIDAKGFFFIDRAGEIGRMVGFFADATAQKLSEAALARAQEELEARVAERTAELAEASRMLRERARRPRPSRNSGSARWSRPPCANC
jgi:C4-dicarboxylate-specific signal transduction histidine kinase